MKKINLLIAAFLVLAIYTNAQTNTIGSANVATELSSVQKIYLVNTWYESPKESSGNTLVFKLTEYVVVVGLDDYNFPPSKLTLSNTKKFQSEYMKTGLKVDPKQTESGTWDISGLKGNILTLNVDGVQKNYTIISLQQDKMVLTTN